MKILRNSVILLVILLTNSFVFAQKTSSLEVTLKNNHFTHVDLINAYGNDKITYASADIVNDKFLMIVNLAHDIYRFDFGDENYMLVVIRPGEDMRLTVDASDLHNLISTEGSQSMAFVLQSNRYMTQKKTTLDSLNNALQKDPNQLYWSKVAQNVNQYKQTNDELDNYLLAAYDDVDTLNALFRTFVPKGKIKGDIDMFISSLNKTLKSFESHYRPFESYRENADQYYNFTTGRVNNHADYYRNLDQYILLVNNRLSLAENSIGALLPEVRNCIAVRDSLAYNNLLDKKSNKVAWAMKVVNLLSEKAASAANQHNSYKLATLNDDQLSNNVVVGAQQIVKDIVNEYQTNYNETDSYINSRLLESFKENKHDIAVMMFLDMFPREQNTALHEEVITALHETFPEHPIVKERWNLMNSPAYKTTVGALAPELAFKDPDGNIRKLSDLRGKVVLIDFWASWCGPCRRENPNVRRIYSLYHDKGFEIYSVSLDRDAASWKRAIVDDKLVWPNHVSDLKQWQSEGAAIYGVRSIPATFLLDREGRIVARDLRGESLEKAVKQLVEQ